MSESTIPVSFGWLRDLPSINDYTHEHATVKPLLAQVHAVGAANAASATNSVDLRAWCSPIENQGNLGSCTAHAGSAWSNIMSAGLLVNTSTLLVYSFISLLEIL
jgi:C1A family cysteine protease